MLFHLAKQRAALDFGKRFHRFLESRKRGWTLLYEKRLHLQLTTTSSEVRFLRGHVF